MATPTTLLLLLLTTTLVATALAQSRFNCTDFRVPPLATNVSQLHPGHVEFVMAMGDSITAAFSARSTLFEARDLSWSIGIGYADQVTLPWLLNQYAVRATPAITLQGMSTEAVLPNDISHLPHNDYHPLSDFMNVAESEGSVRRGSMEEQWALLLDNFGRYKNFKNGWKVLTLWMTANDVCGECDGPMDITDWAARTDLLLTNVSTTLTNVYVNLVSTLDLSNVARIQRSNPFCDIEHKIIDECGCIDRGNATQLQWLDKNVHTMNAKLHEIAQNWYLKLKAQGRSDMAVTVQAFQEGIGSTLDITFLSRLDCFHPSALAHQELAIGLWDSMLCTGDRANRCNIPFSSNLTVTCPTVDSVFYTGPDVVPNPPLQL